MLKLAALFFVLLPGCLCIEEVTISINPSQMRAYPGESVTFICRVYNIPEDGFIYWFKTVKVHNGEDLIDMVALGSQPMPPYDRVQRLLFTSTSSGTTKIYQMTINNVTKEDSGHWGCSYREVEDNRYVTEPFEVYDDLDEVVLSVNGTEVSDEVDIVVVADEETELEIISGRSLPENHVSVFIDDREITRELHQTQHTNPECTDSSTKKNCSLHYSHTTTLSGMYEFNGNDDLSMLTVKAEVIGATRYEPVNKTYKLIVDHAPLFSCLIQQSARRGQEYTVKCTVNARPVADTVYWHLSRDGTQDVYAMPGNFVEDWNAFVSVDHVDGVTCDVSLVLYNVTDYHYTTYELVAGNQYGNETLGISLTEDFSPPVGPSGASYLVSSVLAIMTSFFVSLAM